VIVLCDAEKGNPLAVMDSREITSLRTAAATAVAAKHLARPDSCTLTICGCGAQGRVQAHAIAAVCHLTQILAYDKNHELAVRLSHTLSDQLNIRVTPVSDLAAAAQQSDICVTCTTSREPLLGRDDVRAGTFIAAVGADNPEKQEIHPDLMARSKIVADLVEQCAAMGDLHHALKAGSIRRSDVHAELGEIVAGKKSGREDDDEIIVFDSTGMALQDVAAAALVYERALRDGVGARLQLAA
jgi:ornithine cyclodeaminase/alanine dehydrogenase-like protein (mu-crystallin family)